MKAQDKPVAALTLDFKRPRIRIHKSTLRLLHDPEYFRILINPQSKCIIVENCGETSDGAIQAEKASTNNGTLEVYSRSLIREIIGCAGFSNCSSVKLAGHPIEGRDAAFFRMGPGFSRSSAGERTSCYE